MPQADVGATLVSRDVAEVAETPQRQIGARREWLGAADAADQWPTQPQRVDLKPEVSTARRDRRPPRRRSSGRGRALQVDRRDVSVAQLKQNTTKLTEEKRN